MRIDVNLHEVWEELTSFAAYPSWNSILGNVEGKMKAGNKISTFIVPLKNTFSPVYKANQKMAWKGTLAVIFPLHFTGLFSYSLSKKLIS